MLRKNNKNSIKSAPKKPVYQDKGTITSQRALHVAEELSYNYGSDVIVYDVHNRTPYVSYYIVASAENDRRLQALQATAKDALYANYKEIDHTEGRNDSKWILIDAKDFVIQLFTKEERRRVDFDSLYMDCPHKLVIQKEEPQYRKRKRPESQQGYNE